GVAVLAWGAVTLTWGEPITAIEASRAQAVLRGELQRLAATRPASPRTADRQAAAFRAGLPPGHALRRIVIPRLALPMVTVEGTRESDLARGPGHYRITSLPGRRGTVAIAGHL